MIFQTYYGWEKHGKFYLSVFPYNPTFERPRNEYETKDAAEAEARRRGATIKWD